MGVVEQTYRQALEVPYSSLAFILGDVIDPSRTLDDYRQRGMGMTCFESSCYLARELRRQGIEVEIIFCDIKLRGKHTVVLATEDDQRYLLEHGMAFPRPIFVPSIETRESEPEVLVENRGEFELAYSVRYRMTSRAQGKTKYKLAYVLCTGAPIMKFEIDNAVEHYHQYKKDNPDIPIDMARRTRTGRDMFDGNSPCSILTYPARGAVIKTDVISSAELARQKRQRTRPPVTSLDQLANRFRIDPSKLRQANVLLGNPIKVK